MEKAKEMQKSKNLKPKESQKCIYMKKYLKVLKNRNIVLVP